jgi:rhomboid protease GluP
VTALRRQRDGAIVCPSCGRLVGVKEPRCPHCGRVNPGLWGFAPALRRLFGETGFEALVIGVCAALYLATLAVDPGGVRGGGGLGLLGPSTGSLLLFGASGPGPVFELGRWWTPLSAGWLHGGLLHILFNMLWVRQLAPAAAAIYGTPRTVVLYTLSSVVGFIASSLGGRYLGVLQVILGGGPHAYTVGASAAIFGLLGALVYAGRRGVAMGLGRQAWIYAIALFAFGLLLGGIDNWAHLGGFAGGYAVGAWLDPQRPERLDDVIGAVTCLAASAAAVVASAVVR